MSRKQKGPRPKHVPQRTCIACRTTGGKRTLIRIVRTESGVVVDPSGKKSGRGAYLCASRSCWEAALQGKQIERALRVQLSSAQRTELEELMQTLAGVDLVEDSPMNR